MCPPVVTPGEFFICTADIPRGSDVQFQLEMVDDLNSTQQTSSGWLNAPEQWLHIPGGPLKTTSWNTTLLDQPSYPYTRDNYIIQSTYFQYMANISAIEFVPATTGTLYIDVRKYRINIRISDNLVLIFYSS